MTLQSAGAIQTLRLPERSGTATSTQARWTTAMDAGAVILAYWAAFVLRLGTPRPPDHYLDSLGLLLPVLPILGVAILRQLKAYSPQGLAINERSVRNLFAAAAVLSLLPTLLAFLVPSMNIPRLVPFIFCVLAAVAFIGNRLTADIYLGTSKNAAPSREAVLIYGAGVDGQLLAKDLKRSGHYDVVGFVDDEKALQGLNVAGWPVHSPLEISGLAAKFEIRNIILALPPSSAENDFHMLL